MTPSDRRLHPLSILFDLGSQTARLAIPALLLIFGAGSAGIGWEALAVLFLIPYTVGAIGRYVAFRYRYEPAELVIRSGLIFRNERHIPYTRIQNIDAVQNVLQRLAGVVEVRVQTGGGTEPEATLRVLPVSALDEMRQRVFEQRELAGARADGTAPEVEAGRTLLHLPPRELILCGLVHNRGTLVIAAALGLLWDLGFGDGFTERLFGVSGPGRKLFRQMAGAVFGGTGVPPSRIALAVAAFVALLVIIRLLSVGWAFVRLYGFTLTRAGQDLRAEYGLLKRVVATIPLRRVQTVTIVEGPLHRLFQRVSVRVTTAGGTGGGEGSAAHREWLAPLIARARAPELVREVLPGVDLSAVRWEPLHPGAFGRELRASLIVAVLIALPFSWLLGWWELALLAALGSWMAVMARLTIAHLRWAATDAAVLLRGGALWRYMTVARFAKIQAVAIHESPFDRRTGMARVRVDTAGTGDAFQVDIPYLGRETARDLHETVARHAARTTFKW